MVDRVELSPVAADPDALPLFLILVLNRIPSFCGINCCCCCLCCFSARNQVTSCLSSASRFRDFLFFFLVFSCLLYLLLITSILTRCPLMCVCVCVWVSCWTGELVCERFANSLKLSLSLPFLPAVVLTSCGESVGTGCPGPGVGVCQCVSRAPAECTSWYPATYRSVRRCCFVTPLTLPALCAH